MTEAVRQEYGAVLDKRLRARHSLYGIRMEVWGILFLVFGPALTIASLLAAL